LPLADNLLMTLVPRSRLPSAIESIGLMQKFANVYEPGGGRWAKLAAALLHEIVTHFSSGERHSRAPDVAQYFKQRARALLGQGNSGSKTLLEPIITSNVDAFLQIYEVKWRLSSMSTAVQASYIRQGMAAFRAGHS